LGKADEGENVELPHGYENIGGDSLRLEFQYAGRKEFNVIATEWGTLRTTTHRRGFMYDIQAFLIDFLERDYVEKVQKTFPEHSELFA
jgi:hypothetical protein